MPLFQYLCKKCDIQSEILVRGAEKPECPECGSTRLEKQLSHIMPMAASALAPVPSGCAGGECPSFREGHCCATD